MTKKRIKNKQFRFSFLSILLTSVAILLVLSFMALLKGIDPFFTNAQTANPTDTSYNIGVYVLKYFPLTANGQNIDIAVTGDWGQPYTTTRQKTVDITNNLLVMIPKATKYLGYKNAAAEPALNYNVIGTREYTQAVPMLTNGTRQPDYNKIMTDHNICNLVDVQGVREVWIWAYNGPTYPGSTNPYLRIFESKMSGPWGDISNSYRSNDMPKCTNTYRVYTYNYQRGTLEAFESWSHQIEAEIRHINNPLFTLWQGPNYPQTLGVTGRCGSVHNPPNARSEYDRGNATVQNSDCLSWNPDGMGPLTSISCSTWGCVNNGDSDNPGLNYMIWNWQNLPGRLNTKTYQGNKLRNLWDIHGAWDQVMGSSNRTLYIATSSATPVATPVPTPAPPTPTPSPTLPPPTPSPTAVPTGDVTPPTVSITAPLNNSTVRRNSRVTIRATATDNVKVKKVEFYVQGSLKCSDTSASYTCTWNVPRAANATYTVVVKAYDTKNNTSTSSITVKSGN